LSQNLHLKPLLYYFGFLLDTCSPPVVLGDATRTLAWEANP